jgi:Tfp pilus assembly protein PilF
MPRQTNTLFALAFVLLLTAGCGKRKVNIESALVDQVIGEFATERFLHYLHGGAPRTNRELLEKVLARHSLRYAEFVAPFRRFQPEVFERLLGGKSMR